MRATAPFILWPAGHKCGVVDEDINWTKGLLHSGEEGIDTGTIAHVAKRGEHLAPTSASPTLKD